MGAGVSPLCVMLGDVNIRLTVRSTRLKAVARLAAHQPRQSAAAASKSGPQGDLQNSARA